MEEIKEESTLTADYTDDSDGTKQGKPSISLVRAIGGLELFLSGIRNPKSLPYLCDPRHPRLNCSGSKKSWTGFCAPDNKELHYPN